MPPQDNRKFPRIPAKNAVLVKSLDDGKEDFARAKTMSAGGCSFLSPEPLESGSLLEVLISVDQRVIRTKARVVYGRRAEDARFEVGAEFVEIPEDDREVLDGLLGRGD